MDAHQQNKKQDLKTVVFINREKYELADPVQTGRMLKKLGGISLRDTLFRQRPHDDEVIANDAAVTLKDGDHFYSQPPADYGRPSGRTIVFINKHKHELLSPMQTGRALKELAGIPVEDTLFRQRPHDDEVISNDSVMTLKNRRSSLQPAACRLRRSRRAGAASGEPPRRASPVSAGRLDVRCVRLPSGRRIPTRAGGASREAAASVPGCRAGHVLGPPGTADHVRSFATGEQHGGGAG